MGQTVRRVLEKQVYDVNEKIPELNAWGFFFRTKKALNSKKAIFSKGIDIAFGIKNYLNLLIHVVITYQCSMDK